MVNDALNAACAAFDIHSTAIIEEGARIAAGCIIHARAYITRHCQLDEGVEVHPFAVLGGDPQDLQFDPGTDSMLRIGARTVVREHVTINRATRGGAATVIGSDCLLMAASHVGHDCIVGNHVVLANAVLLGGHVQVGHRAFLGGGAVIHQYCRIGDSAMIGGGARISGDVPPYLLAAERNSIFGLNFVGLRQRGVGAATLREIKDILRNLDGSGERLRVYAECALSESRFSSPEAVTFLQFLCKGGRSIAKRRPRGSRVAVVDQPT